MESQFTETNQTPRLDRGILGDHKTTALVLTISTFVLTVDTVINLAGRWSRLQTHSPMDTFNYAVVFAMVLIFPVVYIFGAWKQSKVTTSSPEQRKATTWKLLSKNGLLLFPTCVAINLMSQLR